MKKVFKMERKLQISRRVYYDWSKVLPVKMEKKVEQIRGYLHGTVKARNTETIFSRFRFIIKIRHGLDLYSFFLRVVCSFFPLLYTGRLRVRCEQTTSIFLRYELAKVILVARQDSPRQPVVWHQRRHSMPVRRATCLLSIDDECVHEHHLHCRAILSL